MKHLATKERRRDREEFVYKYDLEVRCISLLIEASPDVGLPARKKFIDEIVRPELGYNCHTADCDIWNSLLKTRNSLI